MIEYPINVETELIRLTAEDANLQSQIDVLAGCCATCGLNPAVDPIAVVIVILCTVLIGFGMGCSST